MSEPENFDVLRITGAATLKGLIDMVKEDDRRFFILKDQKTNEELGSIEINLVADHDLLIANEGMRKPC